MQTTEKITALFDLDGVILDTETQYSHFWHAVGQQYLGMDDLEGRIKGQTMTYICNTFFPGMLREQEEITQALNRFELEMSYDYIPGVRDFIEDLRSHGAHMAVVTSSNEQKMSAAYRARPELKTLFDRILTAELFAHSKPAPDCYLLGMQIFESTPDTTYVFEDSFNGLKAGMASGAHVIGLATTNSCESIAPLCHCVLPDFSGFGYDKLLQVNK